MKRRTNRTGWVDLFLPSIPKCYDVRLEECVYLVKYDHLVYRYTYSVYYSNSTAISGLTKYWQVRLFVLLHSKFSLEFKHRKNSKA